MCNLYTGADSVCIQLPQGSIKQNKLLSTAAVLARSSDTFNKQVCMLSHCQLINFKASIVATTRTTKRTVVLNERVWHCARRV